jgi:hypothetical protein
VTKWIQLPPPPLLVERTAPYLVEDSRLTELRSYFDRQGARWLEMDLSGARTATDVVRTLKNVLSFPEWCGSSWDSIDDAFSEIRTGLEFPIALIAHGLPDLLNDHRHLALEVVIRTWELQEAFSHAGDQLVFVFAGAVWA